MEFLVVAYDGEDPEAGERRSKARPAHLENVKSMREAGSFINGGAILDDSGQLIGSTLYVGFESRETLDAWLESDPYVTGGVWKYVEVKPIRLVFRYR